MTLRETLDAIAWIIVRAVQLVALFAALTLLKGTAMKKILTTLAAAAVLSIGLAVPADARPAPLPTSGTFSEMALVYRCGPYFHGTHARGYLLAVAPDLFVHRSLDGPRRSFLPTLACQR
jgi:hypothetical protein